MPESFEQMEVRSDEVNEILGAVPHWIIRWGVTSIFIVLVFILIGTWFIAYPDTVSAQVTVTTLDPPAAIISQASGPVQLLVADRENVNAGQFLGTIASAANTADMLQLIRILDALKPQTDLRKTLDTYHKAFPDSLALGQLQTDYQSLISAIQTARHFYQVYVYLN